MTTKQEILDYIMNNPYNTNEAVLGTLLNDMGGTSQFNLSYCAIGCRVNLTFDEQNETATGAYQFIDSNNNIVPFNKVLEDCYQTDEEGILMIVDTDLGTYPLCFLTSFIDEQIIFTNIVEKYDLCCNIDGTFEIVEPK